MAIDNYIKEEILGTKCFPLTALDFKFEKFEKFENSKPTFLEFCSKNLLFYNYKSLKKELCHLNYSQIEFINSIDKSKQLLIKKQRQKGITSILILYINYLLVYGKDVRILFHSKNEKIANRIIYEFDLHSNLEKNNQNMNGASQHRIIVGENYNRVDIVNSEYQFSQLIRGNKFTHFLIDDSLFEDFYYILYLMSISSENYNSKKIIISDNNLKDERFNQVFDNAILESKMFRKKILIEKKGYKISNETMDALRL